MGNNVPREYIILAGVIFFLSAGTGLAFWAGLFTNASLELRESTCQSIAEPARAAFNAQPSSAWKPPGSQVASIADIVEGTPVRNERGEILERRCRGTAVMQNGQRIRFSYKAYNNDGTVAYMGGLDVPGDTRVFRREGS